MDFNVGDKVRVIENYKIKDINLFGYIGVVVDTPESGGIGVDFGCYIHGHDCNNNCKCGNGWYLSNYRLEKISEANDKQEVNDKQEDKIMEKITLEKKSKVMQEAERLVEKEKVSILGKLSNKAGFEIEKIYEGKNGSIVVKFADDKKYKVKPTNGERPDIELAMTYIMGKRAADLIGEDFKVAVRYGVKFAQLSHDAEKMFEEARKVEARQKEKLIRRKKARDQRRREEQIEIQKEAILRAEREKQ